MATSGLVFAIQSLDFSKPENTRFQYGSSVCLLSIAAPIAGTCDDATPAMILATFPPRLAGFGGFGFGRSLRLGGLCLAARHQRASLVAAGLAAITLRRATPRKHHGGVVLLCGAGHHRRQMPERVTVGRAELRGEIDVAAELKHPVVVALEYRFGLRRRELKLLEVLRLVGLEGLAVLLLHKRHAEHVDAEALARALGVEHEGAGDVVVVLPFARHRPSPCTPSVCVTYIAHTLP